jgi:Fe-S-cluster-containing dehydrogenase component
MSTKQKLQDIKVPSKKNIILAYRKERVSFDISQLKLPDEGINESVILFPGSEEYIPLPVSVKGKSVSIRIPDDAVDGFVILLMRCNNDGATRSKNRETGIKIENGLCLQKTTKGRTLFFEKNISVILGYLALRCSSCNIDCPTGALSSNPNGICQVDPLLCIGQTYVTNQAETYITAEGREVFKKVSESQCWNCLNPNETISTKCNLRRLRKVVYNSGLCCGSCNQKSRVTGLTLMELCPNGAISHENGTTGHFNIDNDLCTGCMVCFNNIVCFNNNGSNVTLKMVAYGDNVTPRLFFTIDRVVLLPSIHNHVTPGRLPSTVFLLVKSDIDKNRIKLKIDADNKITISPANNNTGVGRRLSFALVLNESPHPQLITPGSNDLLLPVKSVILPPFCHEGNISLAGNHVVIHYNIHE